MGLFGGSLGRIISNPVVGIPGAIGNSIGMGGALSNFTGGILGSGNANDQAYAQQGAGVGQGNASLNQAYQLQKDYLNPYADIGKTALGSLTKGDFMTQDPGYNFRLGEGNKAINASLAARGLGNSGAALRSLTRYGQDYASGEYDKGFNRQLQLAGIGQNAATNLSGAAGQLGSNLSNNYTGLGNAGAAAQIAKGNQQSNFLNNLFQGGAAMFSDAGLKTNVDPINTEKLQEMKKHLKAYAFNYKNDKYGKGDWIGIMAQDLEKSELGKTLVVHNEAGEKMIDQQKVLSMFLATMAEG